MSSSQYIKVIHSEKYDEWLEERKNSVGASDPCDNTSARRKAGLELPFEGNIHTIAGMALEGAIITWWAKDRPEKVRECGWLLRRPEAPSMHATPDGWSLRKKYVVEIKNVGLNQAPAWLDMPEFKKTNADPTRVVQKYQQIALEAKPAKRPPQNYWRQVQHQLYITGFEYGYLVGLVAGKRLVEFRIKRDEEYIQKRIEQCRTFMEKVEQLKKETANGTSK